MWVGKSRPGASGSVAEAEILPGTFLCTSADSLRLVTLMTILFGPPSVRNAIALATQTVPRSCATPTIPILKLTRSSNLWATTQTSVS